MLPSVLLFTFLAISRLGVWIHDLTTQQLTQSLVAEHQRASFAGVENSIVNIVELLGAASAIVFPDTAQFKWLALVSWVVVLVAWVAYAYWVRTQRGHLIHWDLVRRGFGMAGRG